MSILKGTQHVQFGTTTIRYELTYSERKTLVIHVYPDTSVVVDAPLDTPVDKVHAKVLKRAAWILREQLQFETYAPAQPLPRRYVSGESYRYLGRQYRLKVETDTVERTVLKRGYLVVGVHDPSLKPRIAALIDHWYRSHARTIFAERLEACYPRVESLGIPFPDLTVRDMKARWGSCSAVGRLTLNLKLIQLPRKLIDYVILHELCHLKEYNHSPAFYTLLDRVLPDWRERRQQLNQREIH